MRSFALKMMVVFGAVAFCSTALAQDFLDPDQEKPKLESDQTVATLYGQDFTVDLNYLQELYGKDSLKLWQDASAQIPKVFPDIFDGSVKQDMQQVLAALGWAKNSYRNLYECSSHKLATEIVTGGQIDLVASTDGQLEFMNENVKNKTTFQQARYVYSIINTWFDEGSWQNHVDAYNAEHKDNPVSVYAFVLPSDFYRSSRAVYILDSLVRRSLEVEKAGLSGYGDVPREAPECLQTIEAEEFTKNPILVPDEDWKASQEEIIRKNEELDKAEP